MPAARRRSCDLSPKTNMQASPDELRGGDERPEEREGEETAPVWGGLAWNEICE